MSDHSEIWPKTQKADTQKFVEFVDKLAKEAGDETSLDHVAATLAAANQNHNHGVPDLPEVCLQGRLGELCQRRFGHFPRAYAWVALLTVASGRLDDHENTPDVHTNLYGALVGGVHTGKSQAIDYAVRSLGIESPVLMKMVSGSGEQLVRATANALGNPRVWCVDELSHPLQKMQIEGASFSSLLNSVFNETKRQVRMGKKEIAMFHCYLSILGGLVEERFPDLFNSATTTGFYDRFLFGLCPSEFDFVYQPFNGQQEPRRPIAEVFIDPEVWEWEKAFKREHKGFNGRVIEICIRTATICAAFDDVRIVLPKHLGPHIELMMYQEKIRTILKPNPGQNFEGQCAHIMINYMTVHPGWITRRELFRSTRIYDKGPAIADRVLAVLIANGDIVKIKSGKTIMLRLRTDKD